MSGTLASFLSEVGIEPSGFSPAAGVGAHIRSIGEHGALRMRRAVLDFRSCEFLLAMRAIHGDSVAPYFPIYSSPAEVVFIPDKRDKFIDFPRPVYHVFGDHSAVEIYKYLGLLALHPFPLFKRE